MSLSGYWHSPFLRDFDPEPTSCFTRCITNHYARFSSNSYLSSWGDVSKRELDVASSEFHGRKAGYDTDRSGPNRWTDYRSAAAMDLFVKTTVTSKEFVVPPNATVGDLEAAVGWYLGLPF